MAYKKIEMIKNDIKSRVGTKVSFITKYGKRQLVEKDGVITNAYPEIFVIKFIGNDHREVTCAYSYSDVLTKTVILK